MDKTLLLGEVRYAERLCQRTARLYRRLQAVTVFLSVVGGSGVISGMAEQVPPWMPITGGLLLAVFGAIGLAVRPADKAAANDNDARRYAQLRTAAMAMTAEELQVALNKARESDTQEVDALRDVAYNDLAYELGREDQAIPLRVHQKLLSALA